MNKNEKVNFLIETYGQNDQRTEAWHIKRGQMLTASEIYKALPTATPAQKHELIMSKLTPKQNNTSGSGSRALIWGTRFEPIAKDIYQDLHKDIKIIDTTCIPHPTVNFLGASPDGILVCENIENEKHGKLVEFKCPISRDFNDETPIPEGYYHQMQLQMECTGLDECEYIEVQFKDVSYSEWVDNKTQYKSYYALSDNNDVIYKHFTDNRDVPVWRQEVLKDKKDEYRLIYWVMIKYRIVLVKKQEDWLSKNLDSFQKVWDEIQEFRRTETFPEHPKQKEILVL